jgi:hydroxyacylglutathione hydrolase
MCGDQFVPSPHPKITRIVSIPFEENAYIAQLDLHVECLVVDPGLEPQKIVEFLDQNGLRPAAILNTHGHSDHIGGNAALKARWPDCPLVIGSRDAPKLTDPQANLSALFGKSIVSPAADATVDDGDTYSAAGFDLRVLSVPGHSAGHVVYLWEAREPAIALVGDVIFAGSIGRTDFPDGDFALLKQGIQEKLFSLPPETVLLPGHGPPTTVGEEKQSNPFLGLAH